LKPILLLLAAAAFLLASLLFLAVAGFLVAEVIRPDPAWDEKVVGDRFWLAIALVLLLLGLAGIWASAVIARSLGVFARPHD
jgi:hypothetical protein